MLEFAYLPAEDAYKPSCLPRGTLAVQGFSTSLTSSIEDDAAPPNALMCQTDLRALGTNAYECIIDPFADEYSLRHAAEGDIESIESPNWLMIKTRIENLASTVIEDTVAERYKQVFARLDRSGFPHLVRAWHVIPHITAGDDDSEIYRRFSVGRARAFKAASIHTEDFPAASAIGSQQSAMSMLFLASKQRPMHHENAVQSPAYRYPRQYGPVGPSFARASSLNGQVFISGTASITGHTSKGIGDVCEQTSTTLNNIEGLIHSAAHDIGKTLRAHHLKVYLKDVSYLAEVANRIAAHPSFSHLEIDRSVLFAQADICRSELLVEIEGLAQ